MTYRNVMDSKKFFMAKFHWKIERTCTTHVKAAMQYNMCVIFLLSQAVIHSIFKFLRTLPLQDSIKL